MINAIRSTASYYLPPQAQQSLVKALDQNNNRIITRDELNLSPQVARGIDQNRDGRVQNQEILNALQQNKLSFERLNTFAAQDFAVSFLPRPVQAAALGELGRVIDTDNDAYITAGEMSQALSSGTVSVKGNYLVANAGGNGAIDRARSYIESIKDNTMKRNPYGDWDSSTGIFKPHEANHRIQQYLQTHVLTAADIATADKLELLSSNVMKRNRYGSGYDNTTGALEPRTAQTMANTVATNVRFHPFQNGDALNTVTAIANIRMQRNQYGSGYDNQTGLFTPGDANKHIKTIIQNLITNPTISAAEKLEIIDTQTARRNQYGSGYDPYTGALTPREADALRRKVFDTPPAPYH